MRHSNHEYQLHTLTFTMLISIYIRISKNIMHAVYPCQIYRRVTTETKIIDCKQIYLERFSPILLSPLPSPLSLITKNSVPSLKKRLASYLSRLQHVCLCFGLIKFYTNFTFPNIQYSSHLSRGLVSSTRLQTTCITFKTIILDYKTKNGPNTTPDDMIIYCNSP